MKSSKDIPQGSYSITKKSIKSNEENSTIHIKFIKNTDHSISNGISLPIPDISYTNFSQMVSTFNSQEDSNDVICQRCTNEFKECKGIRGLKIHYASAQEEFSSDFSQQPSKDIKEF